MNRLNTILGLLVAALLTACAGTKPAPVAPQVSQWVAIDTNAAQDAARVAIVIQAIGTVGARGILVDAGAPVAALLDTIGVLKLERIARLDLDSTDHGAVQRQARKRQLRAWLQDHEIDRLHVEAPVALAQVVEELATEALLCRAYLQITSNLSLPSLGTATFVRDTTDPGVWALAPAAAVAQPRAIAIDVSSMASDGGDTDAVNTDHFNTGQPLQVAGRQGDLHPDTGGRIGWLTPDLPDTLRLIAMTDTIQVPTRDWRPPYDYALTRDGAVHRRTPWVELRRAPHHTSRPVYEILARTDSLATAKINDVPAHVYRTGVFFDSIDLAPGPNRLRLQSDGPDGSALYAVEIEHTPAVPRQALPLWIDTRSLLPSEDLELLGTDQIRLQFTGSLGQEAVAHVEPGGIKLPMSRTDTDDASLYQVDLPARLLPVGREAKILFELRPAGGGKATKQPSPSTLSVRAGVDAFPLLRTTSDRCPLSYSLGRVRLGGPFRAEFAKGIVLQSSGRFGRYHRVQLSMTQVGYIHQRYVEELPPEHVRPGYHISSLHASPRDSVDVVGIPWSEPVPYTVEADPEGRRLLITLFGVQSTSTWIQQRAGMRYVERLSWKQLEAQTYQVIVHLTTPLLWGYQLQQEGRSLVLRLPYPDAGVIATPVTDALPLAHLSVAIEAGHGGSNTGALGLSGLFEKDVNLDTALRLEALCRAAGAQVVQIRPADEGIPYMNRLDSLEASGADLVVSIHANSAGGGFLRASGTSTYFHNPFWAPFARRVYDRMLELDYPEFGVVGSFNYRNIRLSSRPTILVEQAFMSHAGDEERMADPAHRQEIAVKILAGILDYLADVQASEANLGPLPQRSIAPAEEGASTSSTGS